MICAVGFKPKQNRNARSAIDPESRTEIFHCGPSKAPDPPWFEARMIELAKRASEKRPLFSGYLPGGDKIKKPATE